MVLLRLEKSDRRMSATEVAQAVGLELPTVSKLLKMLKKGDLVNSRLGAAGGYRLSRDVTEMDLLDVITAIEGSAALTECLDESRGCHLSSGCQLSGGLNRVNEEIARVLGTFTLDRLAGENNALKLKIHP